MSAINPLAAVGDSEAADPATKAYINALQPLDAPQVGDGGFATSLVGALANVEGLNKRADGLSVAAATGDLTDVHQYTIAAAEAKLAVQLTVAIRNKAVAAFNEIMRMPA